MVAWGRLQQYWEGVLRVSVVGTQKVFSFCFSQAPTAHSAIDHSVDLNTTCQVRHEKPPTRFSLTTSSEWSSRDQITKLNPDDGRWGAKETLFRWSRAPARRKQHLTAVDRKCTVDKSKSDGGGWILLGWKLRIYFARTACTMPNPKAIANHKSQERCL